MLTKKAKKRQDLIQQYIPFAESQARQFINKYDIAWIADDFISVAYVGLCKAAKKYNPKKNASFSSFATIYILGAMMDEFRKMDLLTRAERKQRIGGDYIEDVVILDIQEPISNNKGGIYLLSDTLEQTDSKLDDVFRKREAIETIEQAVSKLSRNERLVFCLYVINKHLTYAEIGGILDFSESRICQLLHSAKRRLKGFING